MALAEVVTLRSSNCRAIPSMLRDAANSIEDEPNTPGCSPTVAIVAIQLAENGQVKVYGWGDTDDHRALALMSRGQHELLVVLADD